MKEINVLVIGCNGCMGETICRLISETNDLNVVAGFDRTISNKNLFNFPIFNSIQRLQNHLINKTISIDVIVDFSFPDCTIKILHNIAIPYSIPIVIATTGFTQSQMYNIECTSRYIPIFISSNMSYEINLLDNILKQIAPKMTEYDIEIVETHHNRKKDIPSGTAITLANSINNSLGGCKKIIYGRTGKREDNEIGISSIRGGNIVGEHTINFFGKYDSLIITHTAYSRDMFAEGALKAIRFMYKNSSKNRLFGMTDL